MVRTTRLAVISLCLAVLWGTVVAVNAQAATSSSAARWMAQHLIKDRVSDAEVTDFVQREPEYVLAVFDAGMDMFNIPEAEQRDALTWAHQRMTLGQIGRNFPFAGGCTQNVEIENGTNGQSFAYEYVTDYYCDGSDPDKDYRFNFRPAWAYNSDNLRWYARSGWVRSVFCWSWVYNCQLLGSSLCTSPVQLCLGDKGCTLAGGPGNVKQELWIWSR